MDLIEELKKLPKKRIRTFDSHFHWIIDFDKLEALPKVEIPIEEPPVEAPEPEKVICEICGGEFSPQGYPKHFEACKRRKELEERKAALEAEIQDIGE